MDTTTDESQGGGPRLHHRLQQRSSPSITAAGVAASNAGASSSSSSASPVVVSRPPKRKLSHSHADFSTVSGAAASASHEATGVSVCNASSTGAEECIIDGRERSSSSTAYRRNSGRGSVGEVHALSASTEDEESIAGGTGTSQQQQAGSSAAMSSAYEADAARAEDEGDMMMLDGRDPRSSEGLCIRRLQGCAPTSLHNLARAPSVSDGELQRSLVDNSRYVLTDRRPTEAPRSPTTEMPAAAAVDAAADDHSNRRCVTASGSTSNGSATAPASNTPTFSSSFFFSAPHSTSPSLPSYAGAIARPLSPTSSLFQSRTEAAPELSPPDRSRYLREEEIRRSAKPAAKLPTVPRPSTATASNLPRFPSPLRIGPIPRRSLPHKSGVAALRPPSSSSSSRRSEDLGAGVLLARFSDLHSTGVSAFRRSSLDGTAGREGPSKDALGGANVGKAGTAFLLQPVPASKRRKFAASAPAPAAWLGSSAAAQETLSTPPGSSKLIVGPMSSGRAGRIGPSGSHDAASHTVDGSAKVTFSARPLADKQRMPAHLPPCVPSVLHEQARLERQNGDASGLKRQQLPPLAPHVSHKKRYPRLRRTQSLPNLKARPLMNLNAPVVHRLTLPSHLAQYLASITRAQDRAADPTSSSRGGHASSRAVFTPPLHPPITRHTLRELDLGEILKNPQLRHDVVFDPNVQFRPNFDGERGRRKREAGDKYWAAVVREIERGCTCTAFDGRMALPCSCSNGKTATEASGAGGRSIGDPRIPSRIPHLVQELRAICLSILPTSTSAESLGAAGATLLASPTAARPTPEKSGEVAGRADAKPTSAASPAAPATCGTQGISAHLSNHSWMSSHHTLILQTLDPHLITQELAHGVLDICALITFLGSVLKLHCAPMRDEAIERMISTVVEDRDVGKGLRLCFEILELMKLDIANHQLRTARPYLVDTAVDFETRWFREQIEQGKLTISRTTTWFKAALSRQPTNITRTEQISKAFNEGFLRLIFDSPTSLSVATGSSSGNPASALGAGVALSSSSLNHAYVTFFPETFQFDAYRLITFHADATDITVMYMLLLLFRQLACSPLLADTAKATSLSPAQISSNAATLAARHLEVVKEEIWCLLCDANMSVCNSNLPPTRPGETPRTPRTPTTPSSRAAALVLGGITGSAKLEDPRWRVAMTDVLLQIAARAGAVQTAARENRCLSAATSASLPHVMGAPPSERVLSMLNAWLDTNMRPSSALHQLCQGRLRNVVSTMLVDRLGAPARSSRRTPVVQTVPLPATSAPAPVRKQPDALEAETSQPSKRLRLDSNAVAPSSTQDLHDVAVADAEVNLASDASARVVRPLGHAAPPAQPAVSAERDWEAAMVKAGLEPLGAEVRLLGERVAKVATFHLHVMRSLYERISNNSDPTVA